MIPERPSMRDLYEITRRWVALAKYAVDPITQPLRTGPGLDLFLGPWLIDRLLRKIDVQYFAEQRELNDLLRQLVDHRDLVFRLGARLGHHGIHTGGYSHLLRVTPGSGDLLLEFGIIHPRMLQRVIVHEHQFRPACREPPPSPALPCLDQHRVPLW